jgi:hypothetical protein
MPRQMTMDTKTVAAAVIALGALLALSIAPAAAQTSERPTGTSPQRDPIVVGVGDPCWTRSEGRQGVLKVDACGRWYCGRADVKDIIEVRPDIAEALKCTWRLEGADCRCRRDAAGAIAR